MTAPVPPLTSQLRGLKQPPYLAGDRNDMVNDGTWEGGECLKCGKVGPMKFWWSFCSKCWSEIRAEKNSWHHQLEQVRVRLNAEVQ